MIIFLIINYLDLKDIDQKKEKLSRLKCCAVKTMGK
jgi:hypothetical protein